MLHKSDYGGDVQGVTVLGLFTRKACGQLGPPPLVLNESWRLFSRLRRQRTWHLSHLSHSTANEPGTSRTCRTALLTNLAPLAVVAHRC